MTDYVMRVLKAMEFDCCGDLFWRTDGEFAPIRFMVRCSDCFYYACADLEDIMPDQVDLLEQAISDVKAADDRNATWGPLLYVARVRKMLPLPDVMACFEPPVAALFHAAKEPS